MCLGLSSPSLSPQKPQNYSPSAPCPLCKELRFLSFLSKILWHLLASFIKTSHYHESCSLRQHFSNWNVHTNNLKSIYYNANLAGLILRDAKWVVCSGLQRGRAPALQEMLLFLSVLALPGHLSVPALLHKCLLTDLNGLLERSGVTAIPNFFLVFYQLKWHSWICFSWGKNIKLSSFYHVLIMRVINHAFKIWQIHENIAFSS